MSLARQTGWKAVKRAVDYFQEPDGKRRVFGDDFTDIRGRGGGVIEHVHCTHDNSGQGGKFNGVVDKIFGLYRHLVVFRFLGLTVSMDALQFLYQRVFPVLIAE